MIVTGVVATSAFVPLLAVTTAVYVPTAVYVCTWGCRFPRCHRRSPRCRPHCCAGHRRRQRRDLPQLSGLSFVAVRPLTGTSTIVTTDVITSLLTLLLAVTTAVYVPTAG